MSNLIGIFFNMSLCAHTEVNASRALSEDKKLTKDQAVKKILTLKKDLFNIRFKKVNNQINNPAQYSEIKKNIARLVI